MAARLLGYEVSALLLIPMIGGCVIFDEEILNQRDRAIVVMAGPATGMVTGALAWGIYAWTGWFPAACYAGWSILLTFANLVPLVPMDGGQTLESLMHPIRLNFRIAGFCLVAAVAVGISTAISPMMGFSLAVMTYVLAMAANREWTRERRWTNVCRALAEVTGDTGPFVGFRARQLADSVLVHDNERELTEVAQQAYGQGNGVVSSLVEDRASLSDYVRSRAVQPMSRGWRALMAMTFASLCGVTTYLLYIMFMNEGHFAVRVLRLLAPKAYEAIVQAAGS